MKKTLLLLCLLFTASTAFAQSKSDAVNKLMNVMQMKQQIEKSAEKMIEIQMQARPQMAKYKDVMLNFFNKYLTWERLGDDVKETYSNLFTEQEIRALIDFYQTPTGQKLIKVKTKLSTKMAKISQQVVMAHQAELRQAIMDAMQSGSQ